MTGDHSGDYVTATIRARDEAARELYEAAVQAERRQRLAAYWKLWRERIANRF